LAVETSFEEGYSSCNLTERVADWVRAPDVRFGGKTEGRDP
jgi:hypothetical protein